MRNFEDIKILVLVQGAQNSLRSRVKEMALYQYLQPLDTLPGPIGRLSSSISRSAIKDANKAVRSVTHATTPREGYAKFTPEQQAAIGEYASLQGNQAAIRHFTEQLGVELKVSSGQTWKGNYQAKISRKLKAGEMSDLSVKSLPVKKCGRPLLLAEQLETEVKCYINAVREVGGVITTTIIMAATTAIVQKSDGTFRQKMEAQSL